MNEIVTRKYGIGASVKRKEDLNFITGRGCYTSDITPDGALTGFVLRSAMAHATFTLSGLEDARALPGVHAIYTHDDLPEHWGGLPCQIDFKEGNGGPLFKPERSMLAKDTVRYVGDPIAFIVADDAVAARDAAEQLLVDYDAQPVTADFTIALNDDAAVVWPELGNNQSFIVHRGHKAETDAAFAKAAHVTRLRIVNNRLVANYMETRAAIGEYDPETGRYTLTSGTQGGHGWRAILANDILKIDESRLRVITPDVGGGFGTKAFVYHEYALVLLAAERLGRPVKWVADRTDHYVADTHGRDQVHTAELALDADGKFLGLRLEILSNMGAFLSQYGPEIPVGALTMATGLYDIPVMDTKVIGVFTHTTPTDAYRGAGRPEAAFTLERLVDCAARELGLSPIELRLKNFIPTSSLPFTTPGGRLYDTGEFAGHLLRAIEVADYAGFAARRAQSKTEGKLRGFGIASYVEACAFAGSEEANLQLNADGTVTLFIGTQSNGQGHATAYGQIIAQYLGLELDQIETVQGDTDRVRTGGGTGGSRSIPLGAASLDIAAKVLVRNIKDLAADRLEAASADLELEDGFVKVAGTDRALSLADIATHAADPSKLKAIGNFEQTENTYPNGTHIAEVEIDPETGITRLTAFTSVDDFGVTVNPILLAGQVHGGVVQSIGQALYENAQYDASGQLMTASFMDYAVPRADHLPSFHFETRNVPSTTNMLGIKGAGEAGTIGATPAVMNAVVDALDEAYGIHHIDMPVTPARLWAVLQDAQG